MITRPTLLNDKLIEDFSKEIEEGLPVKYACDLLYVSGKNYQNWMKQGEIDVEADIESIFGKFFLAIKHAKAKWIKKAKEKITTGAGSEWQGMAWWLERTDYEQFSRKDGGDNNNSERIIVNVGMRKNNNKK